jgi:hypothetical protein
MADSSKRAKDVAYGFGKPRSNKGCVTLWPCHLHEQGILRQKKNYENSTYYTMQKYNLQKILYKKLISFERL